MAATLQTLVSPEEYFRLECKSETRNEFIDGKIRPMPYTTENQQLILTNLMTILGMFFRAREEKVLSSDRLLFIKDCNASYYPDIAIFPALIEYKPYRGKMMAALNPTVIIEVLSESTAHIDRGEKLRCYKTIASMKQYLLVSQDEKRVEVYTRHNGSNEWLYTDFTKDEQQVIIGDCVVLLKDIYLKVKFGAAKKG